MRALLWVSIGMTLLACGGGGGTAASPAAEPAGPPAANQPSGPAPAAYPASRREEVVDQIHGVAVADPYRWLEDASRPEVQAWMKTQHDAARAALDHLPRRDQIAARLAELSYFDAPGVPIRRKGRLFWRRKHKDREKAVLYWKQGDKGTDKQLLDPNTWSADGSSTLGEWEPSPDGRHVAFQRKVNNSEEAVLHIIDVSSGRELPDTIPGAKYADVKWTPDGKGFYYTWVPPVSDKVPVADRPGFAELRYHRLGGDPTADEVAYPATGNPQSFLSGEVTDDGRWLVASVQHGWNSTDLYLKDRTRKRAGWQPIAVGVKAVFEVVAGGPRLYVRTNESAPRFRIMAIDPRKPARSAWKEIVPESEGTIEGMEVAGGHLVVSYLRDAASTVQVRRKDGALAHELAIPPLGRVSDVSGSFDDGSVYFQYSSFTERAIVFKASIARGSVEEWARAVLPLDASQIQAEQVRYRSKDGTEITMFLVHKKGAARNGANPTILYGYGGFSQPMLPTPVAGSWGWPWAVWIEMGGMLAIPNLRGGNELGEAWHEAGMLLVKQNVFDDYIAAARYLIEQKWTSTAHLAAMGRSNGGLLVGAAMTQAPELFQAIVCGVPLLDMVRYHLFGSGKTWIPEYGSAEDARQFQALYAYSPYHRLRQGTAYPAVLLLSADSDDLVDPLHARKFTAALQHDSTSGAPVLLRIERHAGHGGADLVKQTVEGGTDTFAFLWQQIGS
ncbi:MAG TPA: prolyl oligopeptidase family serine peptidase [Kofleriaceae bacterium]|nr:prolyl oligopeptidase family serine peptidase [Kofleriaceae bacterium]